MKKALLILTLIFLVACSSSTELPSEPLPIDVNNEAKAEETMEEIKESTSPSEEPQELEKMQEEEMDKEPAERRAFYEWELQELTDVRTNQKFSVSDFKDKPVILETFAVWCPKCKQQQDELKVMHNRIGDEIISIALNVDTNEDADQVLAHVQRHDYDWRFAIAPVEMTRSLIDQYGRTIASAPSVPKVLVCPNGHDELLPGGVKNSAELQQYVEEKC